MIVIGRHVNGITINPLEYALESSEKDAPVKQFPSEESAKAYLLSEGYSGIELGEFKYIKYTPEMDDVEL